MCLELEPNKVFQSFSTDGCTVCPLIDGILAPCNSEDRKVKLLREGMERDVEVHNPSGSEIQFWSKYVF